MKRYFTLLFATILIFMVKETTAQLKIGGNKNSIQPSSILELESKKLGLLLPRMNTAQRDSITNSSSFDTAVSKGLMIYNTDDQCINHYNPNAGKGWINLCRSNIISYKDTTKANGVFNPKEGDVIADEDCRCIMIHDGSKWKPIDDAQNEWVLDSINNNEVYLFRLAALLGDTIVITKDGRLGIGNADPKFFFQTTTKDSMLAKYETTEGGSFMITTAKESADSLVVLTSENGTMRLLVGPADSMACLEIKKDGEVAVRSYGDGTHTTRHPSYILGVDSAGNLVEFTGFWAANSDTTLKDSIKVLEDPKHVLSNLNGVSYYWKKGVHPVKKFGDFKEYGVLAQEVEAVAPDLVSEDGQGYKTVNYFGLIPILIEGYKQQQEEIDQEEKKSSELESRMDQLEKENIALKKKLDEITELLKSQ